MHRSERTLDGCLFNNVPKDDLLFQIAPANDQAHSILSACCAECDDQKFTLRDTENKAMTQVSAPYEQPRTSKFSCLRW